tara:strand:+ start:41 stop:451 length:411 start_codon:yes stop_codon:yes gene_type:complete
MTSSNAVEAFSDIAVAVTLYYIFISHKIINMKSRVFFANYSNSVDTVHNLTSAKLSIGIDECELTSIVGGLWVFPAVIIIIKNDSKEFYCSNKHKVGMIAFGLKPTAFTYPYVKVNKIEKKTIEIEVTDLISIVTV